MTKNIMTVDDSASMRQMIAFTLKEAHHEVIEAADGQDALSKMNGLAVHMVIADINMPNMDGIELVGTLRADSRFRYIPIVMLTTETDYARKMAAKAAGATGWISKPFTPNQLLIVVRKLLG